MILRYVIMMAALYASAPLYAATAQTTATATGAHSQVFGTVNGNVIVKVSPDQPSPPPTNVPVAAADTLKLNALQRHQDALLLAENPTKIQLIDAKFVQWVGDTEKFLSLVFRNVSKLPANKFEFGIIDPNSAGKSIAHLQFLKFAPSATIPKNVKFNHQIAAGAEYVSPLISVSELRRVLGAPKKYCVVLARIPELTTSFPDLPQKPGASQGWDLNLPITFTYWSIFDQQTLSNSGVSVLITQRDMLIPGPNHKGDDIRCHDDIAGVTE